ncbi:SIR2 family protein [Photobacterium damselae subsp. damselae]|uniref:SIR2 family protein n=1 Tax=Photobacterium damselae subsp. damselae TaxID=85581 RepID=A0A850R3P8_PHODD|nr:SIR2 family protein [Photobacterium damselae subsp. damselae]
MTNITDIQLDRLNSDNFVDQKDILFDISASELRVKLNGKKIVFFTGAGFSKSWDPSYPLGMSLFTINNYTELKKKYNFFQLANDLKITEPDIKSDNFEKDCYDYFCDIKFHLDIYKRYPSLMPSFLDKTILHRLEEEMKGFVYEKFKNTVGIKEFKLNSKLKYNSDMSNLFRKLAVNNNISFISTNYDYIIEKIFHDFDGYQLIRGVINNNDFKNKKWNGNKISLFKINGGFEVFNDMNGFYIDYYSKDRTPHIILPSKEQNYDNKYFKSTFIKSAEKLRDAEILIFIGYSMPKEDHTIRFLLKNFIDCHSNTNKEIFIIDKDLSSGIDGPLSKLRILFPSLSDNGIKVLDGDINTLARVS